jgi:hypothetical protein
MVILALSSLQSIHSRAFTTTQGITSNNGKDNCNQHCEFIYEFRKFSQTFCGL